MSRFLSELQGEDDDFEEKKSLMIKDLAFAIDYLHTHEQVHKKIYPKYSIFKSQIRFNIYFLNIQILK